MLVILTVQCPVPHHLQENLHFEALTSSSFHPLYHRSSVSSQPDLPSEDLPPIFEQSPLSLPFSFSPRPCRRSSFACYLDKCRTLTSYRKISVLTFQIHLAMLKVWGKDKNAFERLTLVFTPPPTALLSFLNASSDFLFFLRSFPLPKHNVFLFWVVLYRISFPYISSLF